MKIHVMQCGSIRVDPTVPYGKRLDLLEAAKQITAADKNRITLPVFTYLIEHPKGLILVDRLIFYTIVFLHKVKASLRQSYDSIV